MFATTSALGISWQHLNHPNFLVRAVYRFHVYFHVRLILHKLKFLYRMKMDLAKLKMIMIIVYITVSVTSRVLIQMKYGFMETILYDRLRFLWS